MADCLQLFTEPEELPPDNAWLVPVRVSICVMDSMGLPPFWEAVLFQTLNWIVLVQYGSSVSEIWRVFCREVVSFLELGSFMHCIFFNKDPSLNRILDCCPNDVYIIMHLISHSTYLVWIKNSLTALTCFYI